MEESQTTDDQPAKNEPPDTYTPEEMENEIQTITYECAFCGDRFSKMHSVAAHISSSKDSRHADRKSSDPGAVEIVNPESIISLNNQLAEENESDPPFTEKLFAILWHLYLNPGSSQKQISERMGITGSTVAETLSRSGISWQEAADVAQDHFGSMISDPEPDSESDSESEPSEKPERVRRRAGNGTFEGPATGIDTTSGRPTKTTKYVWENDPPTRKDSPPASESETPTDPAAGEAETGPTECGLCGEAFDTVAEKRAHIARADDPEHARWSVPTERAADAEWEATVRTESRQRTTDQHVTVRLPIGDVLTLVRTTDVPEAVADRLLRSAFDSADADGA